MYLKEKFYSKNFIIIIIFFFSLFFNQYFGNRGVFPLDSFSHFDIGYRVLNGELPFKDYWVVSGPLVDFLQAFLFLIFGVNWQTYLLNASILNGIFAVLTFSLFLEFELDKKSSFFYTICLAILAYPSSGTPFVDHHSTFFSIISIYLLIFAIKKEKLVYWILIPFFLCFAFLSKQVPATYIFFSVLFLIIYNFIFRHEKKLSNKKIFFTLFFSSGVIIVLVLLFFSISGISIQSFIDQYISYPREIGQNRYSKLNYDFKNTIIDFKFIHLIFFSLIVVNVINFIKKKKFFYKINFKLFLISFLLLVSLIQHQIVTRNQIFIFFLIPLFSAFVQIELNKLDIKYKKFLILSLFIVCLCTTIKYHTRFNLERKFHELNNINFSNSIKATMLSNKFKGLKWITPEKSSKEELTDEVNFLKKNIEVLKNDNSQKMLFTNYSFFSVLLKETVNSPTRWFPGNDSAFPGKDSNLYSVYKNFLLKQIHDKNISNIYVINDVSEKNLINYLPIECVDKIKVNERMLKYKINKNCSDLYGKP
jgi:hypothetical protein